MGWLRRLFGGGRAPGPEAATDVELPPPLGDVDEHALHRYRLTLADPAHRELALATLLAPPTRVVEAAAQTGPDGTVSIDVGARFMPRMGAVLAPLNALRRAGVTLRGLDYLDLVTEVDDDDLERAIAAWRRHANQGPHRARIERLAGDALLDRCLAGYRRGRVGAERLPVICCALNTMGCEPRLIAFAAEDARAGDRNAAAAWLDTAGSLASVTDLAGMPRTVGADSLLPVLAADPRVAENAIRVLRYATGPVDGPVAGELIRLARSNDPELAASALGALERAVPSDDVRAAADRGLGSATGDVRGAALGLLAAHWTDEARPVWRASLTSSSLGERLAAEQVLGERGTAEDIADAAAAVHRLIRSKGTTFEPPRAADLISLLMRHADDPVARRALDDVRSRWDRLPDGYTSWIKRTHPSLVPQDAGRAPVPASGEVADEEAIDEEAELQWPLPTLEIDGDRVGVTFDELTAHSAVRERFEELLGDIPGVTFLESDREAFEIRVAGEDPVALLERVWAAAHEPPAAP